MKIPLYALPHRVTIIPFNGSGAYGPSYGAERQNVPANIKMKTRIIRSANGEDKLQQGTAIFQAGEEINDGDKIIWEKYGKQFVVASWMPIEAMGPHSVKVELI